MARRLVTLLVVVCFGTFVFAAAGCGGDDDSSASEDTTLTETTTTEETIEEETTEEETTETEDTDTTDTTDTPDLGDFATSENCAEFAQIGSRISEAFTGSDANLDEASDAFAELTAAAPDEIKDDFQVIADAYNKLADALQGVDLTSTNPDPEALAKLTQISQELDQAALTQASTNISTWAQENC